MSDMKLLVKQLENNTTESVYIFTGEEHGLISEYVSELKKRYKNIVETEDIEQVIQDSKFNSIFGGNKLFILKNTGLFNKKADESFINMLVNFYKQKKNCCLFIEEKVDSRLKQTQALGETGIIEFKKLTEPQLTSVVVNLAKGMGKSITKDLARYLGDLCNGDYNTCINELTKLANAIELKTITQGDIDEHTSKQISSVIFDLTSLVASEKYKDAINLYDTLILRKESPILLLNLLYRQFKILYQITLLKSAGFDVNEIADACDVKPFIIIKNLNLCKFTPNKLRKLLIKCSDIDYKIKSGQIKEVLAVRILLIYTALREDEL